MAKRKFSFLADKDEQYEREYQRELAEEKLAAEKESRIQSANKGKQGVSAISGNPSPIIGEKNTYTIAHWYEDTPLLSRNPMSVTWELFKQRKNGRFTTTHIKKIGDGTFTFGQTALQHTYRLEAYLHKPEGGGLIIHPKTSKIPKIGKVELHYVDNKKGNTFSFHDTLRAKAHTTYLTGKNIVFTLWEDDVKGSGHDPKNLIIDTKTEPVGTNGLAIAEFQLTKGLIKKAMKGEADAKELEFYVTAEYYKGTIHDSDNVNVKNPLYWTPGVVPPPLGSKPPKEKGQPKAKGSPAEQKPISKKEEKGIITKATDYLADFAESSGIMSKFKEMTTSKPKGNSTVGVKVQEKKKQEDNKDCECFCKNEINAETLRKIVISLRKATYDEAGKNFYDWNTDQLFTGGHERFTDTSYTKFAEVLNSTFEKYDITSCIRKIHFLAQCYHETGAFMRSVEGRKNDQFSYDPYRGRGFIHLTLLENYQKFKNDSKFDVVNNPTLVSTNIEVAARSSGWYWKYNDKGNINPFADKDSIFDTSRLVNKPNARKESSINGYSQRVNAINALKEIFKYPQNCCNIGQVETKKENLLCPSNNKDCICNTTIKVENGFINHSKIQQDHIAVIEHGFFNDSKSSIKKIILHRTAGGSMQACKNAFKSGRKNKRGGIDHYGTHFIVGKDGTIAQTANLSKITWHCAGWNSKAIGIEVVGFAIDKNGKPTLGLPGQNPVAGWENLTSDQAKSVACLVKALLNYYGLDKSKIDCHEHLAPKEKGEGQIVFNAIKEYL